MYEVKDSEYFLARARFTLQQFENRVKYATLNNHITIGNYDEMVRFLSTILADTFNEGYDEAVING